MAADLGSPPVTYKDAQQGLNWTGFYLGAHMGASWGESQISEPAGFSVIYGDKVTSAGALAGGQLGYNFQIGKMLLGFEADISGAGLDGSNTCYAESGVTNSADCRIRTSALGDLTGRLGFLLGSDARTLAYFKGGAAWAQQSVDITTNHAADPATGNTYLPIARSNDLTRWGWTVGGGVERALARGWSVKAEYAYYGFGSEDLKTPYAINGVAYTGSASQDLQIVKLGLNYRFGAHDDGEAAYSESGFAGSSHGWEFEFGGRYWYGMNKFQKNMIPPSLISRLTYDGIEGNSGEFFARFEAPNNVFVKGLIGGGGLGSGHMNDEDWGIQGNGYVPYSNTISAAVDGSQVYGSVDAGYDLFRTSGNKFGVFVGYSHFGEKMSAGGCVQIANTNAGCSATTYPTSRTVITEDDSWDSLRLGVAGELMILPRLKLSADAAWLPYSHFSGTDQHVLRGVTFPMSGDGDGVQVEALLSYALTDQFSLGVGGRYWAFQTSDASYSYDNNAGTTAGPWPASASAQAYGLLVQGSYKIGRTVEPLK